MDSPDERLGIDFCRSDGQEKITISSGLILLLPKSNTNRRLSARETTPPYRLQQHDKAVPVFEWNGVSLLAQANSLFLRLGEETSGGTSKIIGVDAMKLSPDKGDVIDYLRTMTEGRT